MDLPIRWNLGDRICEAYEKKNAGSSALHGHHHFLLTLITRGEGVQTLNGKDIPFKAGDLFILSPADFHKNTINDSEGYDYFGVKFPYELISDRLSGLIRFDKFPICIHLPKTTEEKISQVFALLIDEAENRRDPVSSEILLRAMIEQILVLALRELSKSDGEDSGEFANRALGFLHSNFRDSITVATAAAYVGYTPNYFNTIFHKTFGVPFGVYLRNMRLSYAKNLLLSSNAPLTEIAIDAGFGSLSHFSRNFSSAFKLSPGGYRRAHSQSDKY